MSIKKFHSHLLILGLAIILTTILTWPFALNLGSYYTDQGDYATHGSILWWNQDSLKTGRIFNQQEYFKGYLFYPHPYSLAFANNHVFPSLIFSPIYWITNNLPLAINSYVFLTFVFTFIACFYFLNFFVKNKWASLVGSLIFTFNPQIATRFPQHIELLGRYFLPLIFLFAFKVLSKPKFSDAFWLFLFITLNSLTANYFQIFVIIFLPLFALSFVLKNLVRKNWLYFLNLAKVSLVGLIFVPIILYFNLPFWDFAQKEGVERSVEESIFFSARINDFFAPMQNNLLYGNWSKYLHAFREPKDDRGILNYEEHTLFLGILPVILFIVGFRLFLKTKTAKIPFFVLLLASLLLTFGPFLSYDSLNFKLPYYYLYEALPLMKGIRAPGRFEYIFLIPFVLIASFGAKGLVEKFAKNRKNLWIPTFVGMTMLLILENFTLQDYSGRSAIFSKIDEIGAKNLSFLEGKNTLHLPVYTIADADIFGKNSIYSNWLTETKEKTMNGNSGYFPPDILTLLFQTSQSLNEEALLKLSALGIDYLIIHTDLMDPQQLQMIKEAQPYYVKGIIFNQSDIVIVDIASLEFSPKLCIFDRDFDIQFGKAAPGGIIDEDSKPTYAVGIRNKSDCFLPSIYEDRYRIIDVSVDGEDKKAHLRMPIIIGPGERVVLSEIGKELRIE